MLLTDQLYWQEFYFCGRVGGGGVEKSRLKLTSTKVEVEMEAELGNIQFGLVWGSGTQSRWCSNAFSGGCVAGEMEIKANLNQS